MKRGKFRISRSFYIMAVPMAVLFFTFHTFPFLQGVFYSFTNWKGYGTWNFVGLKNYLHVFADGDVSSSYLFTFKFTICATILVNVLSLILACALNSKIKFKNFLKAVYFLPYMLGTLIIGFVFNYIFANMVPQIGKFFSMSSLSTNILGTSNAWIGVLIVTVWQSLAFNTLIYIAGLQTIDNDIYEAASMDGAVGIKKFLKITFPLIAPFFTINMVLSVRGFLMVFDQIMAMTGGGPGNCTTSISVLIYKKGFQGGQFSIQSANAVVLFIIIAVISLIQLKLLEKREGKMQ